MKPMGGEEGGRPAGQAVVSVGPAPGITASPPEMCPPCYPKAEAPSCWQGQDPTPSENLSAGRFITVFLISGFRDLELPGIEELAPGFLRFGD